MLLFHYSSFSWLIIRGCLFPLIYSISICENVTWALLWNSGCYGNLWLEVDGSWRFINENFVLLPLGSLFVWKSMKGSLIFVLGFSRQTGPIGCMQIEKEVYFKELACMMREAGERCSSSLNAGRLEAQKDWMFCLSSKGRKKKDVPAGRSQAVLVNLGRWVCSFQTFNWLDEAHPF